MHFAKNREKISDCPHEIDPKFVTNVKNMSNIELFYLKEAQTKLRTQRDQHRNVARTGISIVLFLIPLSMTIYLIVVGHFYVGNLPVIGKFFESKPGILFESVVAFGQHFYTVYISILDNTEGVKYSFYKWMRFLILTGDHPTVKHKKSEGVIWYKYTKSVPVVKKPSKKILKSWAQRLMKGSTVGESKKKRRISAWDFETDRKKYDEKARGKSMAFLTLAD